MTLAHLATDRGLALAHLATVVLTLFNVVLRRGSPSDQSRATFSAVVEEGMMYNAPFVSLCAVRELLRCELCKDGAATPTARESALAMLRGAASSMPGAREDLIELLHADGLEMALDSE